MGHAAAQVMSKSIFVFGSNLAGRHGKGAALHARMFHGAIYGFGRGRTGSAYAIPTKDASMCTLSLDHIRKFVDEFIIYAQQHPELEFRVTRVGCGLAGYSDEQIAPMFRDAPTNCYFDDQWKDYLK